MVNVAIFDFGSGNLFSLKVALERLNAEVQIIHEILDLNKFNGLILPGVGTFDPAIKSIRNYTKQIHGIIKDSIPILGICLGMEIIFNESEEGRMKGLSILDGEVVLLPKKKKIPHMGWNKIRLVKDSRLLKGLNDNNWFYFVHSYYVKPRNSKVIVAESEYGIEFPAVIEFENFFGTQFHPEKSSRAGALMLKNFLREC